MTRNSAKLLEAALVLSPDERADLAGRLIESLDEPVDDDVQQAWETEIERRLREIDNGDVTLIPWEAARRMIVDDTNGPSHA